MLDKLRALFAGDTSPAPSQTDPAQLAVAALLVEAARADAIYDESEKQLIDAFLAAEFALDAPAAAALRAEAERAQASAVDVHRFTKIAKTLAAADKRRLVERLWTIVLCDDRRDPHEDALIRQLCGLLHVSDRDSGAARQRAAAALAAAGKGAID